MKEFIEYIEKSCKDITDIKDSQIFYHYKKGILDEMDDRACDLRNAGLKDEKVLVDLMKDEYPDIGGNYINYYKAERKRIREKLWDKVTVFGSVALMLLSVVLFLGVSFLTDAWGATWLIVVFAACFTAIAFCTLGIRKILKMKRIFHPIARMLTSMSIVIAMVFVFLLNLNMGVGKSWLIVIGGVIAALITDGIFAYLTKQRFYIINIFLYMPAIGALVYVILAALSVVSWTHGWLLALLGVLIDVIIAVAIVMSNAKYKVKQMETDVWKES
ncbi:MAG: hypothetical protein K5761_00995 [Clostridiales bacterium]|nr:hypothetical protein [Clostridiales bacterium]